jgi:opacity protein-like surface antigen
MILTGVMVLGGVLADAAQADETGNQVFFRAGGAFLSSDRSGEVFTDVFGRNNLRNDGTTGYYVGAGLDLVLSKDVWGMMSKTWAVGEIGVEFKRWSSKTVTVAVPSTCAGALGAAAPGCAVTTDKVPLTMLTVDVAPKIKFMEGSRLRPWIIPVGLDFHVISPPSNDTTVLDLGVQFGAGVEYRLYKAFHIGLDGRYHFATGQTETTNDYGTVGVSVGISF